MGLSSTGYVILGFLGRRPMSGYEIKSLVDKSTRFFWTASYGQIYPELRRLAEAGLIEGEARPQGGRRRTVYRLTAAGHRELRDWLADDPHVLELRDEALLKLFFADSAGPEGAAEILAAQRERLLRGRDRDRRLGRQAPRAVRQRRSGDRERPRRRPPGREGLPRHLRGRAGPRRSRELAADAPARRGHRADASRPPRRRRRPRLLRHRRPLLRLPRRPRHLPRGGASPDRRQGAPEPRERDRRPAEPEAG